MAKELKLYLVKIPIIGIAQIEVEAEDERNALQKAHVGITDEHIIEWEPLEGVGGGLYPKTSQVEEAG